jgi:iron complex outermembrane receptor protein
MYRQSKMLFRKASYPAMALSLAVLTLFLAGSGIALAQDTNDQDSDDDSSLAIEEITVTGTKRDISQQDLGIAVSTVTAQQIERTFQHDIRALGQMVPNLTLTNNNGFNAVAGGVRGTGFISILITKDPSTAILVDDFAFSHVATQFIEMYDIEQVVVYRGPQGTLFGKNTTGGAIAFTTKKPVLGEFFGDVEATYGQYSSNDGKIKKLNFSLNAPIGDTAAVRLAVINDNADGFYTNDKPMGGTFLCFACDGPGQPTTEDIYTNYPTTGDGSRIGGKDVLAAKLKLRYEPNDRFQADLIYEYLRDESEPVATANETPSGEGYVFPIIGFPGIEDMGWTDPLRAGESWQENEAISMARGHQVDADGIYLNMTYSFDRYMLKSITGYRETDEILASTYTGEAYTSLYDASRNTLRDQFQQEFRLTSEFNGPFSFVAGAAYFVDDVEFVVFGNLGFFLPLAGAEFYRDRFEIQWTTQDRESYAFYLDGTYDISESASLTAGIRYTDDKKDFLRMNLGTAANPVSNFITLNEYLGPHINPLPESAFGNVIRDSDNFSQTTYRLVFDYKWSDDLMTYVSYATGFNAGGFSETCGSVTSCSPYASEENDNFEIGLKSDLLDGAMRLNVALFNTQYENLQRDTVVTILDAAGNQFQETQAVNVGESTARGVEVELNWVPTDNLRVDANLGYLDHDYDSYSPSADPVPLGLPGPPRPIDFSSLTPPFSPKLNFGVGLTYFQDLAAGGSLTYNLSMHHQDKFESDSFPANAQGADASGTPIIIQKANTQSEERTLMDAFVTWQNASQKLEITLYGRNLTDEVWRSSGQAVATLWNFTHHGSPREIGIVLGYNF